MDLKQATSPTSVTYGLNPWVRWPLCVVISLPLLILVFVVATTPPPPHPIDPFTILAIIVCLLAFDASMIWYLAYIRLFLSPAGVRVRNFGISTEAAWSHVGSVAFGRGGQGLILNTPMQGGGARRLAELTDFQTTPGVHMFGDVQRSWQRQARWLPLDNFAWSIRHGDLAARIDSFAPNLKAREALEASRHRATAPTAHAHASTSSKPVASTKHVEWKTLAVMIAAFVGGGVLLILAPGAAMVIMFLVTACLMFAYAAYSVVGAVQSLAHHRVAKGAVYLVIGIPAFMFVYFFMSGFIRGMVKP